ncbi:hypothetical protein ES703_47501 [subsurface metagenome]
MKINVMYEDSFQIDVKKVFDLTMQWLLGQHKAKIKESVKRIKYCPHWGKKVEEKTLICLDCCIDLV